MAPVKTSASQGQGNIIQNIALTGTSSSFTGIYCMGGLVDIGGTTGNTIGHPSTPNSIQLVGGNVYPSYGIYLASTFDLVASGGQNIANNTIANVSGSGNHIFYGIHLGVPSTGTLSTIQSNAIRNITMTNTGAAASFRGISLIGGGNGSANGAGPATISGNTVDAVSVAGDAATVGIYAFGAFANAIGVSNNVVSNLTSSGIGTGANLKGIFLERGTGTISANNIHDLVASSTSRNDSLTSAVVGIYANLGSLAANVVEGNTIRALRSSAIGATDTTTVNGVVCGPGTGSGGVQRNRIYDLTNTSGSSAAWIRGVRHSSGVWTIANNEIALTNGANGNAVQMAGIAAHAAGSYYFNSVYLGGTQLSGTANSFGFVRMGDAAPTLTNNLFYNERANSAPATGSHTCIANLVANWATWPSTASDFNVLIAADPNTVGRFNITDLGFAGWKAAQPLGSGGDGNSLSEISGTISATSLFTDVTVANLDIKPTTAYDAPPIVSNAGTPVNGQTTDFGGADTRSSAPDIGADEIVVNRTLSVSGVLLPASATYPGNYDNISLLAGASPTLAGNVNLFGTLDLQADIVSTGAFVVTIRPEGAVTRTSGFVVGNLRKHVSAGAGVVRSFEIGSLGRYAPVDLVFANVATAGYLAATSVGTDHPAIATSPIIPDKTVNRYWTMTNGGVAFDQYDATFNFTAADLDAGANTAAFAVGKYAAPNWTMMTTGVRTATSTQMLGETSFSDFAIGELQTFTLTVSTVGSGSVTKDPDQLGYPGGSSVILTAVPITGWHFVAWSGGATGSANPVTVVMDADKSITATFAINTYTLTVNSTNGSVTKVPDQPSYDHGTNVTLTPVPATGYHFVSWSGDVLAGHETDNPLVLAMDGNKTLTASFALNSYTLTINVVGNGSVGKVPDQLSYDHGTSVQLTATPGTFYSFTAWSGDLAGATNPATILMDGNKTVTATFNLTQITHNIVLPPGWNIVSSYTEPNVPDLDTVLAPIIPNLTIMKNNAGQVYWPALLIDNIISWNHADGYFVYTQALDTLAVRGVVIMPESTPISLVAGWNMPSYLRYSPMTCEAALTGLSGNLVLAKNNAGQVYWPEFTINTIGNMMPGEGYQMYLNMAATLTYPANSGPLPKLQPNANAPDAPRHLIASTVRTGMNATFLIRSSVFNEGDEVGIMTVQRVLVGSGTVKNGKALVTVWGDNELTEEIVDGATEDEQLSLVYWSSNDKKERRLKVSSLIDGLTGTPLRGSLVYTTNAVRVVDAAIARAIPIEYLLSQNYPNPFNPSTTIMFGLPKDGRVRLEVYNLIGQRIATLIDGEYKEAGYHEAVFNNGALGSGVYFYRLQAGNFVAVKKMMLTK